MTGHHRKIGAVMALLAAVVPAVAVADHSYWYLGGGIGAAWASGLDDLTADDVAKAVDITGLPPEVRPPIVSTDSSSPSFEDFDEVSWKLYGGYRFNRYLGIEAMYTDLGSFDREATLSGAVDWFAPAKLVEETEVTGFGLSLIASYPFSESFSVFAKAGAFSWETETSGNLNIQTDTVCVIFFCTPVAGAGKYRLDESGTEPVYGLGLMFDSGALSLRLEWERFTGLAHGFDSETDMDMVNLGIEFRFGTGG